MPNNGVVLVVTSAGSHQLDLENSIKEKSSKKNVKIYFTFSPFCREACGDSLPVYKRLSDSRMFNLSDFSSKSFLQTVVYTVWNYSLRIAFLHVCDRIREGSGYQIIWIFGKIRNSLRPPSFSKNYVAFFYNEYFQIYAWRYKGQIVWNANTWFPEIGNIVRGGAWGSTAVWNLSENLSVLIGFF